VREVVLEQVVHHSHITLHKVVLEQVKHLVALVEKVATTKVDKQVAMVPLALFLY
jgi:hypothetical protein